MAELHSIISSHVEAVLQCSTGTVLHAWFALVDEQDYDLVARHRWHWSRGYAIANVRRDGRRVHLAMHVLLANPPAGMEVDHVNLVKLDNRRANLRVCTKADNALNLPLRRDNTSGYKGVYRRGNRWKAQISIRGVHHFIGAFGTPEEAAMAYDRKALELHGEFTKLNFPRETYAG